MDGEEPDEPCHGAAHNARVGLALEREADAIDLPLPAQPAVIADASDALLTAALPAPATPVAKPQKAEKAEQAAGHVLLLGSVAERC